mmetsp:Transcript_116876/g.337723  ORF Transcript_116876/g.337723 Transcript_116876/m.337723 type:complete len:387 (-) Transcript_116876:991-2151(-)
MSPMALSRPQGVGRNCFCAWDGALLGGGPCTRGGAAKCAALGVAAAPGVWSGGGPCGSNGIGGVAPAGVAAVAAACGARASPAEKAAAASETALDNGGPRLFSPVTEPAPCETAGEADREATADTTSGVRARTAAGGTRLERCRRCVSPPLAACGGLRSSQSETSDWSASSSCKPGAVRRCRAAAPIPPMPSARNVALPAASLAAAWGSRFGAAVWHGECGRKAEADVLPADGAARHEAADVGRTGDAMLLIVATLLSVGRAGDAALRTFGESFRGFASGATARRVRPRASESCSKKLAQEPNHSSDAIFGLAADQCCTFHRSAFARFTTMATCPASSKTQPARSANAPAPSASDGRALTPCCARAAAPTMWWQLASASSREAVFA